MYIRRGNLPGTREGKLVYELGNDAVVALSRAICGIARLELIARGSDDPQVVAVSKALEPINDLLEPVTTLIGAETQIDNSLSTLVGCGND